ncbi:MAG: phage tail tape measure protein [Devosia sp.]|uniref:phage tail tape measure protein n=1 Tax=Devosia sp. TaxID=1871048 RepID=UPI002636D572|nr:phage tail tape measure protein [Devosia sp.]MDB5530555.1 phage tail tape measure protein [Devosia sp.]
MICFRTVFATSLAMCGWNWAGSKIWRTGWRARSQGLRGALTDGKSLKSMLGDIAKSFADIALKAAIQPFANLAGGFVDSLFKGMNPAVTPFAKGGVIASPGYFPMGGGLGLAGEAGPEAIMPLQRGSDGRLGVSGGGGGVNVTFNVTASDARSFMSSEADLSAMLLRAVKRGTRAS